MQIVFIQCLCCKGWFWYEFQTSLSSVHADQYHLARGRGRCGPGLHLCSVVLSALSRVGSAPQLLEQKPHVKASEVNALTAACSSRSFPFSHCTVLVQGYVAEQAQLWYSPGWDLRLRHFGLLSRGDHIASGDVGCLCGGSLLPEPVCPTSSTESSVPPMQVLTVASDVPPRLHSSPSVSSDIRNCLPQTLHQPVA